VSFTAHNIRLDDGSYTKPGGVTMEVHPWFLAARRVLDATFPGGKQHLRIADLGCLEGGYTVAFARLGFQALGLDVREANIEACRYVQSHVNLPQLEFVRDDVWNIETYGVFDAIFCCGLFYHLDRPREFLDLLSRATKRVLILQTHFSEAGDSRLGRDIALEMTAGSYRTSGRSTFVGIKTSYLADPTNANKRIPALGLCHE
jgi:SAM-dependent methyltransferase